VANECPKCQTHNTEDSSSVRIDMRNIGLNNLREEIMGKEVEGILKKSEKIRKSKLILIEIPAGVLCILFISKSLWVVLRDYFLLHWDYYF